MRERRRWKKMEEVGRSWKKLEEDGREQKQKNKTCFFLKSVGDHLGTLVSHQQTAQKNYSEVVTTKKNIFSEYIKKLINRKN